MSKVLVVNLNPSIQCIRLTFLVCFWVFILSFCLINWIFNDIDYDKYMYMYVNHKPIL